MTCHAVKFACRRSAFEASRETSTLFKTRSMCPAGKGAFNEHERDAWEVSTAPGQYLIKCDQMVEGSMEDLARAKPLIHSEEIDFRLATGEVIVSGTAWSLAYALIRYCILLLHPVAVPRNANV